MGRLSTRWLAASRALKRAASRSSMMPIPAALLCEVFRYGARPQPTALLPTKTYCKASAFSTNTVSQRQAGGVTEALKEEIIAAAKTCAETRISAAAGEWYLNTMNQLTTNNAIAFAYTHAAFAAGHLLAQYGFHPIILPLAVPQAAVQPMAAPPAVAANTNNPQTITTGNTIDNPVIISSDSEPNPPVLASSGSDSDEDDPPAHAVPNENAQPAAPTIPAAAAAIMVDRTAQVMDQDVTPLRRDRNADRRNVIARPARRRRVQANTGTNNSSQTTDTTRGIIGYAMRRLDLPPVNSRPTACHDSSSAGSRSGADPAAATAAWTPGMRHLHGQRTQHVLPVRPRRVRRLRKHALQLPHLPAGHRGARHHAPVNKQHDHETGLFVNTGNVTTTPYHLKLTRTAVRLR